MSNLNMRSKNYHPKKKKEKREKKRNNDYSVIKYFTTYIEFFEAKHFPNLRLNLSNHFDS